MVATTPNRSSLAMKKAQAPRVDTLGSCRGVNPHSSLPLHVQIERELRRMIELPQFQNGELLPDEQTLANRFGVHRGTVRAAMMRLVQHGFLRRKTGVGTWVCQSHPTESGVGAWRSLSREMAEKGIQVENFLQQYTLMDASPEVARALQVKLDTPLHRLDRLRGWDGLPVVHSRSWFHPRLALTDMDEFTQPLYEVVAATTGAVAYRAHEEFAATAAEAPMATLLRIKRGGPLLRRRHTVFDTGNRPMEFSEVHYVSARFSLTLDLAHGVVSQ